MQQSGMWPLRPLNPVPSTAPRQNGAAASVAFFPAPLSVPAELMLKVPPPQAHGLQTVTSQFCNQTHFKSQTRLIPEAWQLSSLAGSALLSVDTISYRGPLSVSVGLAACLSQRTCQERLEKARQKSLSGSIGSQLNPPSCSKWHGVNYGNKFIPEDWMKHPYNFFDRVRRSARRVALWDLHGPEARQKMLHWLDTTICESHFKEMQKYGVQVVRVPCGYWNWVTYPEDEGPQAVGQHEDIQERLKNLHRIASPDDYRVYFDRIFKHASKQLRSRVTRGPHMSYNRA